MVKKEHDTQISSHNESQSTFNHLMIVGSPSIGKSYTSSKSSNYTINYHNEGGSVELTGESYRDPRRAEENRRQKEKMTKGSVTYSYFDN
jgi:hypothetical protein